MIDQAKHAGDIGAGAVSLFAFISQWAEMVEPILTSLAALASFAWFVWRFYMAWRGRKTED